MTTRGQTALLKKDFLVHFRQEGNVTAAAAAAGIERTKVYRWRDSDPRFRADFEAAEVESTERMEAEAWRRAVRGVTRERPIFHNGRPVGAETITEYSDTLMIFLLKARNPEKYRDVVSLRKDYRANIRVQHEPLAAADPDGLAAVLDILLESGALAAGAGPIVDAEAYAVHPAHADDETAGVPPPGLP